MRKSLGLPGIIKMRVVLQTVQPPLCWVQGITFGQGLVQLAEDLNF